MAKARTVFVCRECGARFPRWQGRCSQCQEWNTLEETREADDSGPTLHRAIQRPAALAVDAGSGLVTLDRIERRPLQRQATGIEEFLFFLNHYK